MKGLGDIQRSTAEPICTPKELRVERSRSLPELLGRNALWYGPALLLSLFAIGVTAAFPSGSHYSAQAINARLDSAFEISPLDVAPSAALRAEAWSKVRGAVPLPVVLPPAAGAAGAAP